MAHEEAKFTRGPVPFPAAPTVTVVSPATTSYAKVTPTSSTLKVQVRPRTITQSLVYAACITHKIADATNTIAATDPTTLALSKTCADELIIDVPAHIASTSFHVAAGTPVIIPGHKATDTVDAVATVDMSDLASGYTLIDALCTALTTHAASTTYHQAASTYAFPATPNTEPLLRVKVNLLRTALLAHLADTTVHSVSDTANLALVTATTIGSDQASDQTLINLLKAYQNSHVGIGAATSADLPAVIVKANALRAGILAHYADLAGHGGIGDATDLATLTAVAVATDQATANTLLTAEKAVTNLHCAIVDGGAYVTSGPVGLPLDWPCSAPFYIKTDTSAGVLTVTEWTGW